MGTLRVPTTHYANFDETLLRLARSQTLVKDDLKDFLKEITEAVSRCLEVERVSVWMFSGNRRKLQCEQRFELSKGHHSDGQVLLVEQFPNYFSALLEERAIVADDALSDPRTSEFKDDYLKPLGITSMLNVPIWKGGENVGVACHEHSGLPRVWTEEELAFTAAVANIIAVSLEVSRCKGAETALRESNVFHQALIGHTPAATYIGELGENGAVSYVSPQIGDLTGFGQAEWVDRPGFWFSRLHPDDIEYIRGELERMKQSGTFEAVYRIYDQRKHVRWLHDKAVVIRNEDGDPVCIQGCLFDTSEIKPTQEDRDGLVSLIEHSSEFIGVVSYSGSIRTLNKAGRNLVGIGRSPKHLSSILSKAGFIQFEREIVPMISQGKEWSGRFAFKHGATGEEIPVEMSAFRIDRGQDAQDVAIVARDVKKHLKVEEELRESVEQLRHSQKLEAIGTLAGGIAHDFSNMLTVIRGHGDMLRRDLSEDDPGQLRVSGIIMICDRAASLIRQLLTFSRRQLLQPTVVDLNAVLLDLEKMLRHLIGENVEMTTATDPVLGCIRVDPGEIEQVVINLVINARDAMPNGGKLTLETRNIYTSKPIGNTESVEAVARYVSLKVKDTGTGMAQNVKERVFEPFFSTKKMTQGSGLGLSTVYGIVKQSGGEIEVFSEVGKGSTFQIFFPRVDEVSGKCPTVRKKQTAGETILIAEDEAELREIISSFLRDEGYTTLLAKNGDEAICVLENSKETIDLLLADVVMPGKDGLDVARLFLEKFSRGNVIYMSGYHQETKLGEFHDRCEYIPKPFSLDKLARAIRDSLGGSSA